jgi:hypothetical protein
VRLTTRGQGTGSSSRTRASCGVYAAGDTYAKTDSMQRRSVFDASDKVTRHRGTADTEKQEEWYAGAAIAMPASFVGPPPFPSGAGVTRDGRGNDSG